MPPPPPSLMIFVGCCLKFIFLFVKVVIKFVRFVIVNKKKRKKKNYCRPSFFAATIALSFSTKTHCSRIFSLRPSSHKSFS